MTRGVRRMGVGVEKRGGGGDTFGSIGTAREEMEGDKTLKQRKKMYVSMCPYKKQKEEEDDDEINQ